MNKREQQKEKTYREILARTEELFRKIGYENTTIQKIADSCGLSKGALYNHFASKEEVLEEICRSYYLQMKQLFLPIVEETGPDMHDKLLAVMQLARASGMNTASAEFEKKADPPRPERGNLLMEQIMGSYSEKLYREVFSRLFAQGRTEGLCDFEGDPEILAVYIHYLDLGMSRQINAVMADPEQPGAEEKISRIIHGFSTALSRIAGIPLETLDTLILTDSYLEQMKTLLLERSL